MKTINTILVLASICFFGQAFAVGNPYFESNTKLYYNLFTAPLNEEIDVPQSQFSIMNSLENYNCDKDMDRFVARGAAAKFKITSMKVKALSGNRRSLTIQMHQGWSEAVLYAFNQSTVCEKNK